MITIPKNIDIDGGVGPWTYTFSADCTSTGCVTFSPLTGTTISGNIDVLITFFDEDCIDECTITLTVTDVNECTQNFDIPITNICETLNVSNITNQPPFTFSVVVTGGTSPYTYDWTWDPTVFSLASPTENSPVINLTLTNGGIGATQISVVVTDRRGCQETRTFNYSFCIPQAKNITAPLQCTQSGLRVNNNVLLQVETCPNVAMDWTTLVITPTISGITITQPWLINPGVPPNLIRITATSAVTPGIYSFVWNIRDENGIQANPGVITVVVPTCINVPPIITIDKVVQLDCDDMIGEPFLIDVSLCVQSTNPIDWSTFVFIEPVPPSTTTSLGGTVSFSQSNTTITYTIPQLTGIDYVEWTVCDNQGNCADSSLIAIVLACDAPPTANDDNDCASCGEVRTINVLANDVPNGAPIDPSSIMITQMPVNGTAIVSGGQILYTANSGFSGLDTLKYKVANTNGQFSNEATVTITVICAGIDGDTAVCT